MKILRFMMVMVALLLLSNGCCEKEIVYVKTPCPKLQNFYSDYNSSVWDNNLTIKVELYDRAE